MPPKKKGKSKPKPASHLAADKNDLNPDVTNTSIPCDAVALVNESVSPNALADQMPPAIELDGIIRDRHAGLSQAKLNELDRKETGFNNVTIPFLPPSIEDARPPRPSFLKDSEACAQYTDLFKNKLKLLRNTLVRDINEFLETGTEKRKQPTSGENIARLFADPTQSMPISYYAQDLMRLILHYAIILPEEKMEGLEATRAYKMNTINRGLCWGSLRAELANQLPGDQRAREKEAQRLLQEVLENHLEGRVDEQSVGADDLGT